MIVMFMCVSSLAYQIAFRKNSSIITSANVDVLNPSARQYTATGLKPESVYVFRLTAQTRKGWGEAAEALVVTTEKRGTASSLFTRSGAFYYMSLITAACLISSQHALSPQVVPLCLRKRSRPAVCCCHGNQAAMVCLPFDTTPSSTESCPTAIGPSTRHRSTMRPHHTS